MAKKTILKILIMGTVLIMSLGLFLGCGSGYEYKEGDFSLHIEVDKTEVNVGDTVTVTARLENLSGQDISMQVRYPRHKELEDTILVVLFEENEEHDFIVTSESGPLKKMSIKNNAIIVRTTELTVYTNKSCEIAAMAIFKVGDGYIKTVALYSETIKISIKERQQLMRRTIKSMFI